MLAHFSHHLLTALPVPLLPFIRDDFTLDYTQAGLVVSVFNLSYGIGQLPAGWLADRIGPRILITIGICGVALVGFLVGLSQTYIMLIVLLALMGVVGGGYHPSAAPMISASVEPRNRGRALGFHLIGGSGSFFLAPLIAAAIATIWGWRGSFIGLAVPTMIFGIIFYVLLGRRAKMSKTQQTTTRHHDETPSPPGYLRRLVIFIILTTFTGAVTFSTIAFIPLFMVDHFGVGEGTAAAFISIIYSAGLWASPLGGYLSDRLGRVPVTLAVCLITGPLIYLLTLVSYSLGIGALLLIIGIVIYIRMPASEAYILGQAPERHRSMIYGIYYSAGIEGGAVLTPVMGYFIDRFGFYSSFTIAGIAVVAMTLICSVFLWGKRD
ncbi:Multidrug resistance protein MdtG [subsurface metagenome]